MKNKWFKIVLGSMAAALLALSLWGCSAKTKPQAEEEKVLNVYGAFGGVKEIIEEFEKDTGIKINYVSMSSGEAYSRISAERNNPSADVWLGGGIDAFIKAKEEGLLQPYQSPNAKEINPKFVDKDHYWTGVNLVTIGLIVNTKRLENKGLPEPKTWDDLIKPEYKGELIASNPTISGTAYFTIAGILQMKGEQEGWKYLDKFYQQTPFLTKTGSGPGDVVTSGEYCLGVVPDPHNVSVEKSGAPVKGVYLDKVLWWPSPVAMIKGCKHPKNAQKFVDWVLSKKGQEFIAKVCPRVPVRDDITPPEFVPNPKQLHFIDMDFLYWSKKRDEILAEWSKRYQALVTK